MLKQVHSYCITHRWAGQQDMADKDPCQTARAGSSTRNKPIKPKKSFKKPVFFIIKGKHQINYTQECILNSKYAMIKHERNRLMLKLIRRLKKSTGK